jgi:hypothetical protein
LRHTRTVGRPASGRSRTRTTGRSLTVSDARPQRGQQAARDQLNLEVELIAHLIDASHRQAIQPDKAANVVLHPLSSELRDLNHREAFRGQQMSLSAPQPGPFSKTRKMTPYFLI